MTYTPYKGVNGEVYFKDIFFVNIWKLALARGFWRGIPYETYDQWRRVSRPHPHPRCRGWTFRTLLCRQITYKRACHGQNIGLQVLKAEDCETVRLWDRTIRWKHWHAVSQFHSFIRWNQCVCTRLLHCYIMSCCCHRYIWFHAVTQWRSDAVTLGEINVCDLKKTIIFILYILL